jgi:hypothetical protein
MKTRKRRFGVAAAAAVALAIAFIVPGTNTAWSVEQTIAAMKKIETVHIKGKNICEGKLVDFDCWVHSPGTGSDSLRLRNQCGCERKGTLVVQGSTVYAYLPAEKVIRIRDGSKMQDLQYWYEGAKISPWLTGKLLETLKLVGHGWQQTTETDPNTGKEQIVITCSHPPSNVSFLLIVDPENKLVQRAKLWRNLTREGKPTFDAQEFTYNPVLPADFFQLKAPPGVIVLSEEAEEQHLALFDQGENLFQNEKKYVEALEIYWQVYHAYPHLKISQTALMMVGLCHDRLGQRDEAIAVYEKAVSEYADLKGWIDATYYYLGRDYQDQGQTAKALAAFENCLKAGEGVRDPERFPLKDAREAIAKIKGQ